MSKSTHQARTQQQLEDLAELRAERDILRAELAGHKVAERRLAAQYAATRILATALTLEEATPALLRTLCESLDWDMGVLWHLDRNAQLLRPAEVWFGPASNAPAFELETRQGSFGLNVGLPGGVWELREPIWVPDISRDPHFPPSPLADQEGLHAAAAFPILMGEDLVGVMGFFSAEIRQPEDELLAMMRNMGVQVGQFMRRTRLVEALHASEQKQAFLVQFGDRLRQLTDPQATMAVAAGALGEHLGVGRVGYGEIDRAQKHLLIERDWTTGGMPSFAGRHYLDAFGPVLVNEYRAGRTIRVDDALADSRAGGDETGGEEIAAAFAAIDTRAGIGVPLIKNGRWVAVFFVHQAEPRAWTNEEVALVEDVAERTWDAVQRARTEEALRESEGRYRTLFDSIDEGFCVIEMLFDEGDKPLDYRFLEVNAPFEKQTGLENAQGKRMRELEPNHEAHWFEIYGKVALTGESVRFQQRAEALHRWFDVFAYRYGPPEHRHVAVLFQDISERKRAEESRRKQGLERALDEQLANERRRLGCDLHDGLRQDLVGIQMLASSLGKKLEARGAPEAALMREFSGLVAGANVQVREIIGGLVPVKIEADSLLPALVRAAADIERWYGLSCSVNGQATPSLDDEAADHLFHIVQEAMANAAKHADASQIDVFLTVRGKELVLEVRDDGEGLPDGFEKRGGMGLENLRTRAELIGARIVFKSKPGRGTVVSCRLPL